MERQLDQLARLLMVAGALNRDASPWLSNPLRGLQTLQRDCEDEGLAPHPGWFSPDTQGLYAKLKATVEGVVEDAEAAYDLTISIVMGLGQDLTARTNILTRAGETCRGSILRTGASPTGQKVSKLPCRWAYRLAQTQQAKADRRGEAVLDPDVYEQPSPAATAVGLLTDPESDVGRDIEQAFRAAWAGTAQEQTMNLWLNGFLAGNSPSKVTLATLTNRTQTSVTSHWQIGMARVHKALAGNLPLVRRLERLGLDLDFDFTEDLFRNFTYVRNYDKL